MEKGGVREGEKGGTAGVCSSLNQALVRLVKTECQHMAEETFCMIINHTMNSDIRPFWLRCRMLSGSDALHLKTDNINM